VDDAGNARILMTLTAPNCPVAGSLPAKWSAARGAVAGVASVKLELTFDPPVVERLHVGSAKLALGIDDLIPIARLRG